MDSVTMKFRSGRTAQYSVDSEICVLDRNNGRRWVRVLEIGPGTIVHGQGLVVELECPERGRLTLPAHDLAKLPTRRFVEAVSDPERITAGECSHFAG
jgi:hypothetical protein